MGDDGIVRFTGLRRTAGAHAGRNAAIAAALAWLPLAACAVAQRSAIGPPASHPFFLDLAVQVRFLLAVPLLVLVGPLIDRRLVPVAAKIRAVLVGERDRPCFDAALGRLVRARDRHLPDLVLLAAALAESVHIGRRMGPGWQLGPDGSLAPAGLWFLAVSQPLFEFLVFRWLWRLLLWAHFLVRVARLPLALVATHPDRAGGLAFVGEAQPIFALLALPISAVGAANFARRIAWEGAVLSMFQRTIVLYVCLVFALVLGPLLVFAPRLLRLKRYGLLEFGGFAHEYTRRFERKWIGGTTSEDPLGSQDIQALADLGASFTVVREMSIVPVPGRAALGLLVVTIAPMIVPAAVQLSVPEVVRRLLAAFLGHGG